VSYRNVFCLSVRAFVRMSVTKLVKKIIWKRINRSSSNWHSWSTGQGDETDNFGGQEVKGQGQTTPKLHLEAWRRHHSRPRETKMR